MGHRGGAYWGIGSAAESYQLEGFYTGVYTKARATEIIAPIRTDLDALSPAEPAVLENHGYVLADAAGRKHVIPTAPPPWIKVRRPTWAFLSDRMRKQ